MTDKDMLNKALDFIVETQQDNDYICGCLHEFPSEEKYCGKNCHDLTCECVRRFLRYYKPTPATHFHTISTKGENE